MNEKTQAGTEGASPSSWPSGHDRSVGAAVLDRAKISHPYNHISIRVFLPCVVIFLSSVTQPSLNRRGLQV